VLKNSCENVLYFVVLEHKNILKTFVLKQAHSLMKNIMINSLMDQHTPLHTPDSSLI